MAAIKSSGEGSLMFDDVELDYPHRTDVGLKSQLFVYECGGPYGCALSQRSTPVVHTDAERRLTSAFCSQSGHLRAGKKTGA